MESLEEHNKRILKMIENPEKPCKNNIACPKCGEELYDSNPFLVLTSYPPQHHIRCKSCNWQGTRY